MDRFKIGLEVLRVTKRPIINTYNIEIQHKLIRDTYPDIYLKIKEKTVKNSIQIQLIIFKTRKYYNIS
jgi:hypothetical protein